MSETVRQKGKMIELDISKCDDVFHAMRNILEESEHEIPDYYDLDDEHQIRDCFMDLYYEQYFELKGRLFKVIEIKDEDYNFSVNIHKDEEGIYHFDATYYNGGCSLEEALESELND